MKIFLKKCSPPRKNPGYAHWPLYCKILPGLSQACTVKRKHQHLKNGLAPFCIQVQIFSHIFSYKYSIYHFKALYTPLCRDPCFLPDAPVENNHMRFDIIVSKNSCLYFKVRLTEAGSMISSDFFYIVWKNLEQSKYLSIFKPIFQRVLVISFYSLKGTSKRASNQILGFVCTHKSRRRFKVASEKCRKRSQDFYVEGYGCEPVNSTKHSMVLIMARKPIQI